MGKVIACVNEKGGVAKTTTVKNLSIGLAREGKKVLAIDLDPSCNLTTSLGIYGYDGDDILSILQIAKEFKDFPEDIALVHQEEGIDFIPGNVALHDFEKELMSAMQREVVLRWYITSIRDKYDYIFIDCPAGLGIYVSNALFASDSIIIPVEPQFLGVGAMQNLFGVVNQIRRLNGTNSKPEILGILFTKVRSNTNNDRELMEYYISEYKDKINIFSTFIPHSVRFAESDGEGESIYSFANKSSAAMTYLDLVKEFLMIEDRG